MDAIRTTDAVEAADPTVADQTGPQPQPDARRVGDAKPTRVALFTDIAVGDAP
jgi:hypothetical protein